MNTNDLTNEHKTMLSNFSQLLPTVGCGPEGCALSLALSLSLLKKKNKKAEFDL